VPVAAQIGGAHRHDNQVPDTGADLLSTPGTQVRLAGLKRVDPSDLDRAAQRGINAHRRMATITANAAATVT
jgi:hypothetical protein